MKIAVSADIHYGIGNIGWYDYSFKDPSLFSGSRQTEEIITSFPKVKFVFCGHTHQKKKALVEGITAINIGSDYLRKRFEIIEV